MTFIFKLKEIQETRFRSLETRFRGLETRFRSLETRFRSLETRFRSLETRFRSLMIFKTPYFATILINICMPRKFCLWHMHRFLEWFFSKFVKMIFFSDLEVNWRDAGWTPPDVFCLSDRLGLNYRVVYNFNVFIFPPKWMGGRILYTPA